PGHHGIDRHLLGRHRHLPVGDERDLVLSRETDRIQHGAHTAFGRRHHGKSVGPALLEAELDGLARIVHGIALGYEFCRHGRDYTPIEPAKASRSPGLCRMLPEVRTLKNAALGGMSAMSSE